MRDTMRDAMTGKAREASRGAAPSAQPPACPFHAGMESHVGPYADARGVIVKATSDAMFGPSGLGFAPGPWMRLVSWLARSGISEQTGSQPDETIAANCVLGWGQGAFSSHVFRADGSVDKDQLERLIAHLGALAQAVEGDPLRITSATAAAFVGAQRVQPYLTHQGLRKVGGLRERLSARFRGHIQWQSLVALCGHVTPDGTKILTPQLLRAFFAGEQSFFVRLVERRRGLRAGELAPGQRVGLLADPGSGVDPVKTDRSYLATKSSLWVVLKILYYIATRKGARLTPL